MLTKFDNRYILPRMPALKKSLEKLGLNKNEVSVMAVLLASGPMLVATIAQEARLNRTTTYGVLKALVRDGLVATSKKRGADRFESIAPEQLPSYVERRREALAGTIAEVKEIVPQLKLLRSKGRSLPKVRFFEGEEGVRQAYEDTLGNNKEMRLRDITGVDAVFNRLGEKWVRSYMKKRADLGISCTDLAPESEWARKSKADDGKYLRTTKFLPAQYGFDAELSIYDDKVGIFSYSQEHPVALIIEDAIISDMMKKLFACLERTAI